MQNTDKHNLIVHIVRQARLNHTIQPYATWFRSQKITVCHAIMASQYCHGDYGVTMVAAHIRVCQACDGDQMNSPIFPVHYCFTKSGASNQIWKKSGLHFHVFNMCQIRVSSIGPRSWVRNKYTIYNFNKNMIINIYNNYIFHYNRIWPVYSIIS